jgi:MFS family permease
VARELTGREKRRLALLGLPTFGLALSITTVSTYLPSVIQGLTSSTIVIGAVVGGEGVMALWAPLVVGPWSDQLRTRIGGRLPFLLVGVPLMAAALVLMGLAGSFAAIAAAAAAFFLAYFVAYEPYRAMYPDLLRADEVAGRAQSTQAIWRGAATGTALLAGGFLLDATQIAPFAAAAAVALVGTAVFAWIVVTSGLVREEGQRGGETPRVVAGRLRDLVAEHPALRTYLVVNGLWELAIAALKTFVVLYLTVGLGHSLGTASAVVGGVGVIVLAGAAGAGKLGDRFGHLSVVRRCLWVFGLGLLVPAFVTFEPAVAAIVPFIALGGGAVMALAYAILMPLMPEEDRGALTGFYSVSRGIGITIGPVLAGVVISVLGSGVFESTHGYQATWLVCSAAILLSIPGVRRLEREHRDRERLAAR